jgi:hypothetical protein
MGGPVMSTPNQVAADVERALIDQAARDGAELFKVLFPRHKIGGPKWFGFVDGYVMGAIGARAAKDGGRP